ncbi:MAG: ABC transporter permease [Planctomycetota bacterium]
MSTSSSTHSRWNWEARDFAPLISLGVLVVFFACVTREFLSLGTLTLVLQQASVLAIVSVGLTFVLICGEIDLSVGMMALWTACFCGVLFEHPSVAGKGGEGDPSILLVMLVILLPLASSLVLGLASGILTVGSRLPSFIITLAMMNIADGLARYLTKSEKFSVPGVLKEIGNGEFAVGGGSWTLYVPHSALLALVVLVIGHVVLVHTRFGRYVYMTGGNREATRLAGVRTDRIVVACLALCAVTAGIGGLVNAGRLESVSLDQNADLLLSAVACVVLGGTSLFGGEGSMLRTVVGVLTFSVLGVGLIQIQGIDDLMRPLLMGGVLMVALVINGLLGRRS